ASLTGHLVFSTLHTNDAAGAMTRLVEMGVEPFLVASSILAVLAQRLVRVLCPSCREPYEPPPEALEELGIDPARFRGPLYRPVGCPECRHTGYRGRTGIYELLRVNDAVRELVMQRANSVAIKEAARRAGMITLREDGARKVAAGVTSAEEVLRVTQEEVV
ncbi:GspE/PulE family protein, partial [Deferrisoma sp.]